jgi:hypothetical protein
MKKETSNDEEMGFSGKSERSPFSKEWARRSQRRGRKGKQQEKKSRMALRKRL